jgi:hypothetical protein
MESRDFIVRVGEQLDYTWDLYDASAAPLAVVGYTSRFEVFGPDDDYASLMLVDGAGTTLATGSFSVTISEAQTRELLDTFARRRSARYRATIFSASQVPTFVASGKLSLVRVGP